MTVTFLSTAQAVRWAEEMATRPGVGSQIGKLLTKAGGGDDPRDLALSISCRLSACDPKVGGLALRAVYGVPRPHRDWELAQQIALRLAEMPYALHKGAMPLCRLGAATIKAERALCVYGDRYPLRRMAKDVGVKWSQFRSFGWQTLRSEATETLRHWMDGADRELSEWLDENGLLHGGCHA